MATTPDPRTGKLRHPNSVLGYLSSFRGVFTVAVQQLLIDTNPMDKVAVGSKIESKRRPYSVEQVTLILTRAQAETDDIFLPLLAQAYAGCRVAEIVDCLRRRIELRHSCGVQVRRSRRAGERASRTHA